MSPEMNKIDQAFTEIQSEVIDPAVVDAAGARVWAQLSGAAQPRPVEHIRTCADFQSLFTSYRSGHLPEARAMLVKDHIHECVACRRIFEGKVLQFRSSAAVTAPRRTAPAYRWAAAAVVVIGAGYGTYAVVDRYGFFVHNGPATIQVVNGTLYRVSGGGLQPLGVGQELPEGIEIRTAKDSGAVVQLRDGSLVEMRERSGFSNSRAGSDLTLRLTQGSVIVQAAKRRSGHLFVATPDCRVAVTGTVFSVSSGVKGSRVSVVEGEVHVTGQNGEKVLRPGEQVTTNTSMSPLRVQDDIAWSRDFEKHLALLKDLQALQKSLDEVRLPELRYGSKLVDRLPANTVFYSAIPNLANYLGEAQGVFRQKLAESPVLREWIEQKRGAALDQMLSGLKTVSEYLGDEIVVAAMTDEHGRMRGPVLLAEEKRAGLGDFLRGKGVPVAVESRGGLVAFGADPAIASALLDTESGGFSGTPLYARVTEAYRNGAGLLFAADVSRLNTGKAAGNIQYVLGEQKQMSGRTDLRAVLGFNGPRQGIAAWLASPAPMGALTYISPEATFVGAFAVRNPSSIVDEIYSLSQGSSDKARSALARLQAEIGFDLRNDLAASMGGEFALALDGPAFPTPSWKLIIEAYDAARLQFTVQKFVEAANREFLKQGKLPLRTAQEVVNGRTYYMLAAGEPNPLTEAHYTFVDGYFVAAPSRALVDKALQTHSNGYGLSKSSSFLAMLPRDHYTNFSALVYQNLGTTLAPLAGLLGQQKALEGLGNMKPSVITAYGEADRIEVSTSGSTLGLSMASLLNGDLAGITGRAIPFGGFGGRKGARSAAPAYR